MAIKKPSRRIQLTGDIGYYLVGFINEHHPGCNHPPGEKHLIRTSNIVRRIGKRRIETENTIYTIVDKL